MLSKPKRFRLDQIAWLHAKVALIVWGTCYIFKTPTGPLEELGRYLTVCIGLSAVIGSIIGIIGLSMTTSNKYHVRHSGHAVEVSGLILAVCGLASYFVAQVALIHDETIRITIAAFGYAFTAFIFARIMSVMRAISGRGR